MAAAEAWDDMVIQFGKVTNRGFPEHRFLAALAATAHDGGAGAAVKSVPVHTGEFGSTYELDPPSSSAR